MSTVTRFDDWLCDDEPTWVPENEVVATCSKCPLPYEDHIIIVNAEFGYDEVTCPTPTPAVTVTYEEIESTWVGYEEEWPDDCPWDSAFCAVCGRCVGGFVDEDPYTGHPCAGRRDAYRELPTGRILCDDCIPAPSVDECPAGGKHVWTDDVDARYTEHGSRWFLAPPDRWHCDECGASPPARDPWEDMP